MSKNFPPKFCIYSIIFQSFTALSALHVLQMKETSNAKNQAKNGKKSLDELATSKNRNPAFQITDASLDRLKYEF